MRRRPLHPKPAGITPASEVLFGVNPLVEALRAAPASVDVVWAAPAARSAETVVALARSLGVRVEAAERVTLDRLTGGGHHQGVAARVRPFAYVPLERLLGGGARLLAALDGVTDPQNLGAIIRSAEVLGAGGLVLPRERSAPVTPAAVRASAGASAHLPVAQVVNLARALAEAKQHGYWTVALDAAGPSRLRDLPQLERVVLVIGCEGTGIRPLVLRGCDFRVRIPVRGRVRSLNASVAAGIAFYELAERLGGGEPDASQR